MKLEAQTLAKIKSRINEKVMSCHGTWIDWQYLLDAAALLAKCRYTLQYTYPYAYYMEPSPRKELVSVFEKFSCENCWSKVEKILKGSLYSIPSPSVKIKITGGKVCLRSKGKKLLGVVKKKFADITQ